MKKFIVVFLMFFVATPSFASVACDDMAMVATKMMEYRQTGVPYQKVISSIPKEDATIYRLFKALADGAYKHQIYSRGYTKAAVTDEFTEAVRNVCNESQ